MCANILQGTGREVPSTQRLESLLQSTVKRGLRASLWVQEKQLGHGQAKQLLQHTHISTNLSCDDTYKNETMKKM